MTSTQQAQRKCVSCGRTIEWNAVVCQYCGHDYGSGVQLAQPPKKNHTALTVIVLVVIVIVVVTVLPLLLYIMTQSVGVDGTTPVVNVLRKSDIVGGYRMEFTAPTSEVVWSDVTIQLSVGVDVLSWNKVTTETLTSPTPPAVWNGGQKTRGTSLVGVYLNITDMAGNGRMSNGDYVTIQKSARFEAYMTYKLTLLYEPTDFPMLSYQFTGQVAETPDIEVLMKSSIAQGFKIEFTAPTAEVAWSDVTIYLVGDVDSLLWDDATTEALTSTTPPAIWHGSQKTNGTLSSVYLNITDLAADGRMSYGDYVTIQMPAGFSPSVTYALMLHYEPGMSSMLVYTFTG